MNVLRCNKTAAMELNEYPGDFDWSVLNEPRMPDTQAQEMTQQTQEGVTDITGGDIPRSQITQTQSSRGGRGRGGRRERGGRPPFRF